MYMVTKGEKELPILKLQTHLELKHLSDKSYLLRGRQMVSVQKDVA